MLCFLVGLTTFAPRASPDEPLRCVAFRDPLAPVEDERLVFAEKAPQSPKLDGRLDDDAWRAARAATGFVEHHGNNLRPIAPGQTEIRCVYSADTLFVAARCAAIAAGRIRHDRSPDMRDGDVFRDDCVEVVLVVGSNEMRFVVAAGGARADALDSDPAWNPEWTSAVAVGDQEWTAEIAIPFAALQGRRPPRPDDPGSSLRFNVGRSTAPIRLVSSLFPGYDDRRRMGWLVIGTPDQWRTRQAARAAIHFDEATLLLDKWAYDAADGEARGRLHLVNAGPAADGPKSLRARFSVCTVDRDEPLHVVTTEPLSTAVVDFEIDTAALPVGSHKLRAEILDDAGTVIRTVTHPLVRKADTPAAVEGVVPLVVDLPDATAALVSPTNPLPVHAGIPLPRGAAGRAATFVLEDANGRKVPCQADVITTWAPRGSTQWLGLRFLADTAEVRRCQVRYSSRGDGQAAKTPRPVTVKQQAGTVTIDTGPLRFEVQEQGFDGLHLAWLDLDADGEFSDDEQLIADSPAGPYVTDQAGTRYLARLDPDVEVDVETAGPICAVVRCAGWYRAEDGARICRHVTRFVAHAGLPWVRVMHTLIFCADSRETSLTDVGWPITLRQPSGQMQFGGEPRPIPLTLDATDTASLLQHQHDAFVLRRFRAGASSKPEPVATGSRAGGWAEIIGNRAGVAVGLRDFAATYPRELAAGPAGLVLHLWPGNGIDAPNKPPTEDDFSELWFLHHRRRLDFQVPEWFSAFQASGPFVDAEHEKTRHRYVRASATANGMGVARSCEFFINFRTLDRDTVRPVWTYLNAPPLAAASPAWMCDSGAFGELGPVDRRNFPLIEQALDVRHDGERSIERFSVGMFNDGGSTSYFRPEKRSYDQLDRPWRLTHHGSPRVPWLLFARSGDRKFADYALRHGQWCADIGFCHYSTPALERGGVDGKIRGGQCDYKGIVPWSRGGRVMDYNSMADFLLWMTCFSGDRRPLEVAAEWGQCVKQRFRPVVGRNAAGTLDTLLTLYETTWDMDYRELAERQFLAIADREFLPSGHFRHGPWYDYAPWLAHYHRFTGSRRAADVAVAWSYRLLRDCWLGNDDEGVDTKFVYGMGYPLYDVFRIAFEATGDRRLLDFAAGCSLLPALSTVSAPGTPFHGFDTYATASHGGYYTQTVPYVLPTLREHGHDRALFPPWNLHARRIQFFVRVPDGDLPELRVRILPPADRRAAAGGVQVKLMSDRGTAVGPLPLEIERRPVRPPTEGEAKEGENDHGCEEFGRITIPPEMRGSTVAVVLAYPRGEEEIGIRAPIQTDRPTALVYAWERGMRFGRGSAIYFQPARGARDVAIRANANFLARPHMIALLDAADQVLAIRQWQPTAVANTTVIQAPLRPEAQRDLVCCLQGLTKHLGIEPESPGIPRYFADRPERFFVPEIRR